MRSEPPESARGSSRAEACLVVIYGSELGRRIPLGNGAFEIGRSSKSDLPIDQESVSRHHARITRGSGLWAGASAHRTRDLPFIVADLGSTNGTYVNDVAVTERALVHGDQVKIGHSILKFMIGENIEHSYHEEIYRLMTVDGLTQVFNKRYFGEVLEREVNRAIRYKRELSLFILDIDEFRAKNDQFGHVAGDALLRQLATAVKEKLRREDIFARVEGDAFAVLLPEVGIANAVVTAEKVRRLVEERAFRFEAAVMRCTVSLGVASAKGDRTEPDALYRDADKALRAAKVAGRNRVAK